MGNQAPMKDKEVCALLVLAMVLSKTVSQPTVVERQPLYLMHIWSPLDKLDLRSVVDFSLELINNDTDILPTYQLVAVHKFAGIRDVGEAVKAFIDLVSQPPVKILILGPTYTEQAKVIADVAAHYNLLQIGYTITSPLLSNKDMFPLFARTVESTAQNNPAILKVLDFFHWKKVAKLVRETELVSSAALDFQERLDKQNFTTLAEAIYTKDPTTQLHQIEHSEARIIVSFNAAPTIFCQIYRTEMFGARQQWLVWSGRYGIGALLGASDFQPSLFGGCSRSQVMEAVEGTLFFDPIRGKSQSQLGHTGIDYDLTTLNQVYSGWCVDNNRNMDEAHVLHDYAVDGVLAAVLTLAANTSSRTPPTGVALEQFNYHDKAMGRKLYQQLTNIAYTGVSGDISFNSNGDRSSRVVISQVQDGVGVAVGVYDLVSDVIEWSINSRIRFVGGEPPRDSDILVQEEIEIDPALYYTVCTLAASGLIYCLLCIMFNIKYRKTRLVKLSSPRINTMTAIGCALSYIFVMMLGVSVTTLHHNTALCKVRVWILVFGFTFAFGSLFSKTWRVHALFTNKKLNRKVVKDRHLFAIVLAIAAVDALYLAIWTAVDPLTWNTVYMPLEHEDEHLNVVVQHMVSVCSSQYLPYWTGFMYGFKALLLIFGIFFAWETRKVEIEALNDSKQIGICVYNVTVMSVIAVPFMNLLSLEQVNVSFVVVSTAVLICATATLLLMFSQKMYQVVAKGSQVENAPVLPFAASLSIQKSRGGAVPGSQGGHGQHGLDRTTSTGAEGGYLGKPSGSAEHAADSGSAIKGKRKGAELTDLSG